MWPIVLSAGLSLICSAGSGHAAIRTWLPQSGDWLNGANWNTAVPTANDQANISNGGTAIISQVETPCDTLELWNGTVQMTGGSFDLDYGAYIGGPGTGTFIQTGGTFGVPSQPPVERSLPIFYLGYSANSLGTYILSGPSLLQCGALEVVGYGGAGVFNQSGGTNVMQNGDLELGFSPGSSGKYSLSGSGILSGPNEEYVDYKTGTSGQFQQTSGSNCTGGLLVGTSGAYQLYGGTLQIATGDGSNGLIINNGIFDGGNSPATLTASNCTLDFTSGTWQNLGSTSVVVTGTNSLVIVPKGWDTSTAFASYSNLGITHTAGTTLILPPGSQVAGSFTLNDPVNCQGSLTAFSDQGSGMGTINLNGGITLSGTAHLGHGSLTINDSSSSIISGSLVTSNIFVGNSGSGSLNQLGGSVYMDSVNHGGGLVYLGYQAGDSGSYSLSGSSQLNTDFGAEYVGYSGNGAFTHSGGTNSAYAA